MPKASKKTTENLYSIADKHIMDARIKINHIIKDGPTLQLVDDILFKLNHECPTAIIKYFNRPKNEGAAKV